MRIAYVTESFPPDVNGVASTAMRVCEQLTQAGHDVLIIAPEAAKGSRSPDPGCRVVRVPSLPLPLYRGLRMAVPGLRLTSSIADFDAEVVHLAGPFMLGAAGAAAAAALSLPSVAVYATDMPAFARAYHTGRLGEAACWRRLRRIHDAVDRTLAPSSAVMKDLRERGFERVWLWGRGVDTRRFNPAKRDPAWRVRLAPGGEVIVGYVGRLAPDKRLDLLREVDRLPGVRLVIVGAGPAGAMARRDLPSATFLGERHGDELARIYASLDVFVHAGPHDTFGNTLQEAAASGVPTVAPAAGGPLDLVADGATGFLVRPGDGPALAAAVSRLADDATLRGQHGTAARRLVAGRDWPSRCDELVGHYEAVRGASRGTRPVTAALA